jgi:hypothetical protein
VFKHDAVVGCTEGALEVGIHDVEVLVSELGVLHHHDDGGQCVVDAAVVADPILLVAKDTVGLCVL